jgi:hypothetical protein
MNDGGVVVFVVVCVFVFVVVACEGGRKVDL